MVSQAANYARNTIPTSMNIPVKSQSKARLKMRDRQSRLRLVILGGNEHFGMEDIVESRVKRTNSVSCYSTEGEVLYLSCEDFIHLVNNFKLNELLLKESKIMNHVRG